MHKPDDSDLTRKNRRTGLFVLLAVIAMIGVSFASVPLYRLFCQVTGFGGTTQIAQNLPGEILERKITVKFNADVNRALPWDFKPEQREITVNIGQRALIAYAAHNKVAKPTAGTAIYNVTPLKAGKYFHKIQCFCFDEQIMGPGQKVSMPVMFYVDPAMAEDPGMNDVSVITLSYTFFPADSSALEQALEAFYNEDSLTTRATH
ncbi:MAG: cytochrome c oxidase assembly protein CtaG [Micavibrio sp.]|nr:MAG: cytochrome c oxidase assembly protein CtaG [Micavibrio sp.]